MKVRIGSISYTDSVKTFGELGDENTFEIEKALWRRYVDARMVFDSLHKEIALFEALANNRKEREK